MRAAPLPDIGRLRVRPVTAKNWADLEALFEAPGGPRHCWCVVWRAMPKGSRTLRQDRKDALHDLVASRQPIGLLAYLDGAPVAWCSVAPRPTYRRMGPELDGVPEESIWSIVCFFMKAKLRRRGVMTALIGEATAYARKRGAAIIEAYPVAADAPSYRFMGFVPVFREAGFREIARIGTRRHLMQKRL